MIALIKAIRSYWDIFGKESENWIEQIDLDWFPKLQPKPVPALEPNKNH